VGFYQAGYIGKQFAKQQVCILRHHKSSPCIKPQRISVN
jgi:hypothetical protein